MTAREEIQGLSWDCGEVGKPEEVDQPHGDDQPDEGLLAYEVDGGEVDGEEDADHGHHHSELHVVQQQSRH